MHINKSYTYVYPMIEDVINYEKDLLGCYIGDENKPKYNSHIFLRYKFDGNLSSAYMKFEEEIQELPLLEDFYDIMDGEDNNTVMFVFKVPEKYIEDYNYFRDSRYSLMSPSYKKKVIDYHSNKNPANRPILEGVLYKTKEYKEKLEDKIGEKLPPKSEFSSKWSRSKEYFPRVGRTFTYEELLKDFIYEGKT